MKVAVFSFKAFEQAFFEKYVPSDHQLIYIPEALTVDTVHLAEGADAISIFVNDDCSALVLEKLKELHIMYITCRCAGTDNVDLVLAKTLSIKVANAPDYSPYSIAEHAAALLMALNRKLIIAEKKVKMHDFRLDGLLGFDLHGKTVGIIGTGKIGGAFARIMNGFGCKILAFDPKPDEMLISEARVMYTSIKDLVESSDIISLHAPLNEHTRYLINKETIALMKKGVMIINTGRGAVICTKDVIEGLKSGKIGALGLDVYEFERGLFFYDHSQEIIQDDQFARLQTFNNVLITSHQAFLTDTALSNITETTIYNLNCFANQVASKNEV